jgi:nucleoid DNA-binding protein
MAVSTTQLIADVAESLDGGYTRIEIKEVVTTFFETMADRLNKGEEVTVSGYLSLKFGYRPGRRKGETVRNPFDGTERKLEAATPAKITVKARPLAKLKNATPSATSKVGRTIKAAKSK